MPSRALLLLLALASCAPQPSPLVTAPMAVTTAPDPRPVPPAAMPEPVPPAVSRPRPDACQLEKGIDAFLMGQQPIRCGELPYRPGGEAYERARSCVIAAQRARKPFTVIWAGPHLDSIQRSAFVARDGGDDYEVRWFHHETSCCGPYTPGRSSRLCRPLVELRAACKNVTREKWLADEELQGVCDDRGEVSKGGHRMLEMGCFGRVGVEGCGGDPE